MPHQIRRDDPVIQRYRDRRRELAREYPMGKHQLPPAATCSDARDMMGPFLAGNLGTGDRGRYLAHVRVCAECREALGALVMWCLVQAG